MAKGKHKWVFKARFRAGAYGWRGSSLANKRLKEAVSEINKVAKREPVEAAEGAVALLERLWPALQDIDTSTGALGGAVSKTLEKLIPLLIDAPADEKTRRKWLERLFTAIQEDGVEYGCWRDPDIRPGETPLFRACGVTPQTVIEDVKPPFCITHKAGHMLITDRLNKDFRAN